MQSTQIGSDISSKAIVPCGVPQGSVLGPLLFLIYVNDIHKSSSKLSFYLFADDTNILYADKSLQTLEVTVNDELLKVHEWLTSNKLTLNVKKSNYVIFHPYQKKIDLKVNIMMFDSDSKLFKPLEEKKYIKYLGVIIDSNLSWKYHIGYITSKLSRTIGIIARIRHHVPTDTLLTIYRSLILPYLYFGLSVWGQAAQTYLNQILVLQKRALRLIYFAPYRTHAIPLFLSSNTLPIDMLYFRSLATLMYDVSNNIAPPTISDLFRNASSIHTYNTRFALANNYFFEYSRLGHKSKSFSRIGVKVWNSIPVELRRTPKHKFKKRMHVNLLNQLQEQDDYVGINMIISNFSNLLITN